MTAAPQAHPQQPGSAAQRSVTVRTFAQRFSSTPRGARLARHLAQYQLDGWGLPYGTDASDRAAAVIAELAANAVTHGRVPGRDFELRLVHTGDTLRIEVSDARTEDRPPQPPVQSPPVQPPAAEAPLAPSAPTKPTKPTESAKPAEPAETGRGLVLVEELADRWWVADRAAVGKTVRAELDLPQPPG